MQRHGIAWGSGRGGLQFCKERRTRGAMYGHVFKEGLLRALRVHRGKVVSAFAQPLLSTPSSFNAIFTTCAP